MNALQTEPNSAGGNESGPHKMQEDGILGVLRRIAEAPLPERSEVWELSRIKPAPENDAVYGAISWNDPDIRDLARSIKEHGLQEPIIVSSDGYIISGHRRRIACAIAKLVLVPVRVLPVSRAQDHKKFLKLLVDTNTQRVKSPSALLHETLINIDPKKAHQQIVNERKEANRERWSSDLSEVDPLYDGRRCTISAAKKPFLDAVIRILDEQRDYWALTVRQVHYRLLGLNAPLTHASKPGSRYTHDDDGKSYRKLTDILVRGRIDGFVPWEAIEDTTRPVQLNNAFSNVGHFLRQSFDRFLTGYWRRLMQSQPNHIEIVAEKLTLQTFLGRIATEHTLPFSIIRGMSSLTPKKEILDRYRASQKDKLILLVVSDLDPAGDAIAEDLVKSFRRDFGLEKIEVYWAGLTFEQVQHYELPPSGEANKKSPTYRKYVERYGTTKAWECEAMAPADLANELERAVDRVIDIDLYNRELAAEEADSAEIIAVREKANEFFKSLKL